MACLKYTTVASATILTSTSSIFTLLIGALTRTEKFTWRKLAGVVASLAGIVLISKVDLGSSTKSPERQRRALDEFPDKTPAELLLGDSLALFSAMIYGVYTITLKRTTLLHHPLQINMPLFFGLVGTFNFFLLLPLFPILHLTGIEPFALPPNKRIWTILLINSASSLASDICWAYAMILTSPLVVTVGLSLTIPLSLVGEMIIQGRFESWVYWVGAGIVVGSFIFVDREEKEDENEVLQATLVERHRRSVSLSGELGVASGSGVGREPVDRGSLDDRSGVILSSCLDSSSARISSDANWISSSDTITVNIDDQTIILHPNTDLVSISSSDCGVSLYDYSVYDIVGVQPHSSSSLTLRYTISNSGYASASYGIFKLNVLIRTTTPYSTLKICYNTRSQFGAPCNAFGYAYNDKSGTARLCDSSCYRCFGPGPENCFGCASGYSFNGTRCFLCDTTCASCNGPSNNQCTRCKNGNFLQLDNNTCTSSCNKPYTEKSIGTFQVCSTPCQPFESLLYDRFTKEFSCQLKSLPSTTIVSITQGLKITTTVVVRTLLLLTPGSSVLLLWGCLSDMLKYIRYMDIGYSQKLLQIFAMSTLSEMIISAIPSLDDLVVSKFTDSPLPTRFQEYDEHSSFLANSWEWLCTLIFVAIIVAISTMLALLEKPKFIQAAAIKVKEIFQWNYCISTFVTYYGNLVFNSSLEFLTASYTTNSGLPIASLVICICANIAAVIFFGKVIAVIHASRLHLRSNTPQTQLTPHQSQYGIILEDYKTHSWLQQSYFALFIIRIYIFNVVIVYLHVYPTIQGVMISMLALFMVLYLMIVLPMKKNLDLVQSIFQEFVLLTVNVSVTILAFFDKKDIHGDEREIVENIIIWSNLIFFAFCFICMNIAAAQHIKRVYLLLRACYRRKCRAPKQGNIQPPAEISDLKALNQSNIIDQSPVAFMSHRRRQAKVEPSRSSPRRRHNQLNQQRPNEVNLETTSNYSSLKSFSQYSRLDGSDLKLSRKNVNSQRNIEENSQDKVDAREEKVEEKMAGDKREVEKIYSVEKKVVKHKEKKRDWHSYADFPLQQEAETGINSKDDKYARKYVQHLDMIVEDITDSKRMESTNKQIAQRVVRRQEMD